MSGSKTTISQDNPTASAGCPATGFAARVAASGDGVALRSKISGAWRATTWSEWDMSAREIAAGLVALGVAPGEGVVLCGPADAGRMTCELAIWLAGAVVIEPDGDQAVPLHRGLGGTPWAGVVDRVPVVIAPGAGAGGPRKTTEVIALAPEPALQAGTSAAPASLTLAELRARGRDWLERHPGKLVQRLPPAAAAAVVTCGTGPGIAPRVVHHGALWAAAGRAARTLGLAPADEQLLAAPVCAAAARVLLWAGVVAGARTAFAAAAEWSSLREVGPTVVLAGAWLFDGAGAQLRARLSARRRNPAVRLALAAAGPRYGAGERRRAGRLHRWLAERVHRAALRELLGGCGRALVCAGTLPRPAWQPFRGTGLVLLEMHGSEVVPARAIAPVTRPGDAAQGGGGPGRSRDRVKAIMRHRTA